MATKASPRELWIIGRHGNGAQDPPKDARVVVQDLLTYRALDEAGHDVVQWDQLFPSERLEELTVVLADLRRAWSKRLDPPLADDLFVFEDIRLTELIEYGLTYVLVDVLRSAEIVGRLLADSPSGVVASGLGSAENSFLRVSCRERDIPVRFDDPVPGAPRGRRGRRGLHSLHALSRWYRMRRRLARFRKSRAPLRILYRENRYSRAVVKTQHKRLAALAYPRGGKYLKGFLSLAALFSKSFRARRRAAAAALESMRARYREAASGRLMVNGVDVWPHLRPHLDAVVLGTDDGWRFANPFASGKTRTLEDLLDNILYCGFYLDSARPEAVVVSQDSWDLDKIMVACARTRGIGTVTLQHGVPGVYYPLYADRFMAWGETCAEFYVRNGEPKERVVVTGRPLRDYLAHERAERHPVSRRTLGVPDDARLILYIGQPSTGLNVGDTPVHWQLQLETLFEGTRELDGTWVVIRPHPTEDPRDYEALRRHFRHERSVLAREPDLLSLIDAADVVILRDSTVSLDTIQLEKPIVVLDRYAYPIDLPFELDDIPVVREPDQLAPALERALSRPTVPPERSKFLHAQVAQDGARACQAVYDAVLELRASAVTQTP